MDSVFENICTVMSEPDDLVSDYTPKTFAEYLGQAAVKEKLAVYTKAARMRNEPLDHLLLFGPPGLGKTTLATIMAHVMDVAIKICSAPTIERTGDMVALLSSVEPRDILFIDEIHRLPAAVEEILYTAMEQFRVDVIIGQGAGAKSVSLPLPPFTLIGATTKSGSISAPLRSRFGIIERLDYYEVQDLVAIINHYATFLRMSIDVSSADAIARCARGTPRIAKKLFRRVRDFAQVNHVSVITVDIAKKALSMLGLDEDGLSSVDRALLYHVLTQGNGNAVGIETLAALTGEDVETLEMVNEPYLLRLGLLEKTSRGRQIPASKRAYVLKKIGGQQALV